MKSLSLFILLFTISFYTSGQGKVWKKLVSRVVVTADTGDAGKSIAAIILTAAKSGKVGAYDVLDNEFKQQISPTTLKEIIEPQPDSIILIDPVDGREVIKIVKRKLRSKEIFQYRIWEEWTYDPAIGKATIVIKYVAPMIDIYGDDGTFRAKKSLFVLNYKDLYDLLAQSSSKHPLATFNKCLWNSYFAPNAKTNNTWRATAVNTIDMDPIQDTVVHFLRDEHVDTFIGQLISEEVVNDHLPIWNADAIPFSKQLTKDDFMKQAGSMTDTQTIIDPVDGHEIIKAISRSDMNRTFVYHVLQNWSYEPVMGKTEIIISGMAPKLYENPGGPVISITVPFWIKYNDLQPILNRAEEYHPNNTVAMKIWDSFFRSDTKPMVMGND